MWNLNISHLWVVSYIVKLIISISVICFSMFEFKFQNVLHTRIHFFCAFALVFIMLALVPDLSSFVSTVQSEVGHGAGKPRACHHLWEIAHSFLLLYWLQSTKTLPSGLCFNGLVSCLMPSMRKHDYTSWLCIMYATGKYIFQH